MHSYDYLRMFLLLKNIIQKKRQIRDGCDTYVNSIESIRMFHMRRHEDHG